MKILSVYNSKGGVGKTITAANLGALLALDRRVLLIDTDSQYSLSSFFVSPDRPPPGTIHDILFAGAAVRECVLELRPRLHVIASHPAMDTADRRLPDEPGGDLRLKKALRGLGRHYDVILIDVPSGWGSIARNAIMAATHLLVPINCDKMAFDSAVDTFMRVEQTTTAYDQKPPATGVLLTSYRETQNAWEVTALCEETWPRQTLQTHIRHTEKIKELALDRSTVADRQAGTGREDYTQLAKEITQRWLKQ